MDSIYFGLSLAAIVCIAFASVSLAAIGCSIIYDAITELRQFFKR